MITFVNSKKCLQSLSPYANICDRVVIPYIHAGVSELADEADSKSVDGNIVWVQVPSPAVINSSSVSAEEFFVVKKFF